MPSYRGQHKRKHLMSIKYLVEIFHTGSQWWKDRPTVIDCNLWFHRIVEYQNPAEIDFNIRTHHVLQHSQFSLQQWSNVWSVRCQYTSLWWVLLPNPSENTDYYYATKKLIKKGEKKKVFLLVDFYRLSQLHDECLFYLIELYFNVWLKWLLDTLQAFQ